MYWGRKGEKNEEMRSWKGMAEREEQWNSGWVRGI